MMEGMASAHTFCVFFLLPLLMSPKLVGPPAGLELEAQAVLAYHNMKRAIHNAPPLALHPKLMEQAQSWAESVAQKNFETKKSDCPIQKKTPYAQIVQAESGLSANGTGVLVARKSYADVVKYDFDKNDVKWAGKFAAMVFKGTTDFGIGIAEHRNQPYQYIICFCYYPPYYTDFGLSPYPRYDYNVCKGSFNGLG